MAQDRRSLRKLAALLPAGALGMSISLAAADAAAMRAEDPTAKPKKPGSVANRLQSIRQSVSGAIDEAQTSDERSLTYDPETQFAWWGNGGWRNGGWRNWGNGWHNGGWWNGGWHNWGNGLFPWGNWHNHWGNW